MFNLDELKLPRPLDWYYENGYLNIDLQKFGKYLSILFTHFLENNFSFQIFNPRINNGKDFPIWNQEEDHRTMAIISNNSYEDNSKIYNATRTIHACSSKPQVLSTNTIYSKEYETLFAKSPLAIKVNDYLLYFGIYSIKDVVLTLGTIKDGKFIGYNISSIIKKEVKYNNQEYSFIDDFINAIFYYKIVNIKPKLDDTDMESILGYFGINKEETPKLVKAKNKKI